MGDKHPYDESDLSRAVADDVSLIDRYDAAGQSYRQQYYDDRYYNSYLPFYSTYPYYGYYPAAPDAPVYWYYCPSYGAYYPNVTSCPDAWVPVPGS